MYPVARVEYSVGHIMLGYADSRQLIEEDTFCDAVTLNATIVTCVE